MDGPSDTRVQAPVSVCQPPIPHMRLRVWIVNFHKSTERDEDKCKQDEDLVVARKMKKSSRANRGQPALSAYSRPAQGLPCPSRLTARDGMQILAALCTKVDWKKG
ncbi:hypothetical protein ANN_24826 [Periplaneta americana]|uniref:Uncharacterized protein n=1 Tax=Periplaneta americana TaxID=6978 RepID=A0ABQ8RZP3_PERAM|nr:hypothetical protein ANN_24826 [Periplaneta americana]